MICVGCPKIPNRSPQCERSCRWDWEKRRFKPQAEKHKEVQFERDIKERLEQEKPQEYHQPKYPQWYLDRKKSKTVTTITKTIITTVTETTSERQHPRAVEWARAIKRRDRKCVLCSRSEGILHAHHIERWIDNKALRFDMRNGASLCITCHVKWHGPHNQPFPRYITAKLIGYIESIYSGR